jgi:preprotein translocase subunit SecG
MLENLVWIVHVISALAVIGLVLLQHGKGADLGAAFGSGSAGSLFGSRGSANFLSRSTAILAAVFFTTSLALAWISSNRVHATSVIQKQSAPAVEAPKTDAAPAQGSTRSNDIPVAPTSR